MSNVLTGAALLRCRKYRMIIINNDSIDSDKAIDQLRNAGFKYSTKLKQNVICELNDLSFLRLNVKRNGKLSLIPFGKANELKILDNRTVFCQDRITAKKIVEAVSNVRALIIDV